MPEDPYAYIMAAYQVPPSPDYIPGPEEPQSPPPLDFVPEPMYPEYMPQEDEILSAEEQPLPAAASPTADSPGYVPESDLEEEPEEDDEDPEEDPADYPSWIGMRILSPPISPARIKIRESCLPPRKRPRLSSPTPIYEVRETSAAGAARHDVPAIPREVPYVVAREDLYKFVGMVDNAPRHPGCPISRDLDYGNHGFGGMVVKAIEEIRTKPHRREWLEDDRSELRGRVTLWYRDGLFTSSSSYGRGGEAWMAREAWGFSMDISDDARSHVLALRTTVMEQRALISGLQAADHQRQVQLTMALQLLKGLQTQMADYAMQPVTERAHKNPEVKASLKTPHRSPQLAPRQDPTTTTSVTSAQLQAMIDEGVKAALAALDTTRNGDDSHSSGVGIRRPVQVARECTYPDFLKCQPLNFKALREYVGLTRWFERWSTVFSISNCTTASQVKFATCTLQDDALTWWNAHVKTTTPEAAHAMPWAILKKKIKTSLGCVPDVSGRVGTKLKDISVACRYDTWDISRGIVPEKLRTNKTNRGKDGNASFDKGVTLSFVSTTFSSRIVITPTALDHDYDVELADGGLLG
ncbi:hypothetical protein Tco_0449600 [Tanacetum coccineum]